MGYEHIVHGFDPVFDENSRILILGSLPSVKSREQKFYYGHPQNRFWRLTAALRSEDVPVTVSEKKQFLLRNCIALWDAVAECDIIGSSDAAIRDPVPTDLRPILAAADIRCIFVNGSAAGRIYDKYQRRITGREAVRLPSTSPANAAFGFERLLSEWKCINYYL